MSKLLIDEYPLQVLPTLAKKVGLNEAIFLQQLHYWLTPRPAPPGGEPYKPHYREWEGEIRPWIFNSYEEKETKTGKTTGWVANFPWWSSRTIKRIVDNLRDMGLIITTDKFSQAPRGRMLWYTIDYGKLKEVEMKEDWQPPTPGNEQDDSLDSRSDNLSLREVGVTSCHYAKCQVGTPSETTKPETTIPSIQSHVDYLGMFEQPDEKLEEACSVFLNEIVYPFDAEGNLVTEDGFTPDDPLFILLRGYTREPGKAHLQGRERKNFIALKQICMQNPKRLHYTVTRAKNNKGRWYFNGLVQAALDPKKYELFLKGVFIETDDDVQRVVADAVGEGKVTKGANRFQRNSISADEYMRQVYAKEFPDDLIFDTERDG